MKKTLFLIAFAFNLILVYGQNPDTTYWKTGGVTSMTFSQTQYKYWSAGGENSAAFTGIANLKANYLKDKISWKNTLDLGYGLQKSMNAPFRKTDDKIDFASKFGYKAVNKFYYSGLINFKTQFTEGYEYLDNGDSNLVSGFMAPGYLLYSVGIDYLPNEDFSIYTSPLTGKTTFVMNDYLSNIGAYGVDTGKTVRYEFGAYVKAELNKKITDNLTINTKVGLFSNYLKDPQNIDVNFDLLASLKVTKFITVNFTTQMIYDHDILVLVNSDTGYQGRRLQIKEIVGIGIAFNF
ncbi:MAG: DUF3078 domain-containing protein [Bacteroidales bacterium]|nr:DUF3078 domain-containing protein [Bacteroidales bacterium]